MANNSQSNQVGAFIPITDIYDVAAVYQTDVTSPEFKELIVRLYQNLNRVATVLNIADKGYYDTQEFINGQLFFPLPGLTSATSPSRTPAFRQVYRTVVNFGALPNTATKSVPHYVTCNSSTSFTRIYGCATNPSVPEYIPLPYASATLNNNIELYVDGTNVNVITAADYSAYTICYIIIEYLQN